MAKPNGLNGPTPYLTPTGGVGLGTNPMPRHFLLTLQENADSLLTEPGFKQVVADLDAEYWSGQVEVAPTTGRRHYQLYLGFKREKTFKTVLRAFEDYGGPHVEKAHHPFAAWQYCNKDETRAASGWSCKSPDAPPRGQGARKDLELACAAVAKDGLAAAVTAHPTTYVKYSTGLGRLALLAKRRLIGKYRPLRVIVYWGETGTGKTRRATEEALADFGELYIWNPAEPWFDGYDDHKCMLIDEFYGQAKPSAMLKLLDGYIHQQPIKGGFTVMDKLERVYITSNIDPREWWSTAAIPDAVRAAVRRRLTKVVHFRHGLGRTIEDTTRRSPVPTEAPEPAQPREGELAWDLMVHGAIPAE